jgi:hypothetical protein
MCNFTLPNQLRNWPRFFLNRERYLDAAENWLQARLEGSAFPRIEDDVDKRMMKTNYDYQGGWEWSAWGGQDEDDYPLGDQGAEKKDPWWKRLYQYYNEPLPLVPKLPAPSGMSGVDLATVF